MSSSERASCQKKGCFATFEAGGARADEVRHCNRSGPDGGHPHRWDLTSWQIVEGAMEHDRT
jgi:hypothetical protein